MDQVAQIREKIDIVSLLSEYIPLKQAGRNFKALCPFHSDKTPSFVVSPQRQIWHCFGCGKGGDAYTFLMEFEHLEFPEALRTLAKRTGVELEQTPYETGVSTQKEKIYTLNKLAAQFYHYLLLHHSAGKKALTYLTEERQIKEAVIKTFQLGYAPSSGNALAAYLIDKKKYTKDDLIEAGLAFFKRGQAADFFTNRLMFPLCDHRDNVIGFSGRIMEPGDDALQISKYVNTRETLVYHKGSTFFGLHVTKQEIKKEDWAIIMEGEFDVMTSFQEGIGNAVAVKGTALTESQVNLIGRFAKKVSLCFDQDKAGKQALKRSIAVLDKKGLTITVIVPPNGKDPDDALKTDPGGFKKAVKHDIGIYDYFFDYMISQYDKNTSDGKKKITDELLPLFAPIENEIVKEHYLRKLSTVLDTSLESIERQLHKLTQKLPMPLVPVAVSIKKEREEILEEYLLSLIVQSEKPKVALDTIIDILTESMSRERAYQKILYHMLTHFKKNEHFDSKTFGDSLPQELVSSFNTSFLMPLPVFVDEKKYHEELIKVAQELNVVYLRQKIQAINDQIKRHEKEGNKEELLKLQEEFSCIVALLEKSAT